MEKIKKNFWFDFIVITSLFFGLGVFILVQDIAAVIAFSASLLFLEPTIREDVRKYHEKYRGD